MTLEAGVFDGQRRTDMSGTRSSTSLEAELQAKSYKYYRPAIEKIWGTRDMSVQDPFGNRLTFTSAIFARLCGIAITWLGAEGMARILAYQNTFIGRGVQLETRANTKTFTAIRSTRDATKWLGSDYLTYGVLGLFGFAWIALAAMCICCLGSGANCPTPICAGP